MKGAAAVLIAGAFWAAADPPPVNSDAAVIGEFGKRVNAYLALRGSVEGQIGRLKPTSSAEAISRHEREMRHRIRAARKDARQGDIFSPEIAAEIRRLIALAMQPQAAKHVEQSLRHAEPVRLNLHVNDTYPEAAPLQSTPPTLLENLPKLPAGIEYRINGRDLLLLDARARLVLDIVPGVFA
jgi:hypothetical protein